MDQTKGNAKWLKFMAYLFPVLVMGIFVLIMYSGPIVKKPLDKRHQVSSTFNELEVDLKEKNWEKALADLQLLRSALGRSFKILQFSVERDEITRLTANLDRVQGFIKAKDERSALGELYEAKGHWLQMGK